MKKTPKQGIYDLSKRLVLIATMSAILIVAKFCIAFVPNIEIVTTLVVVFAYVFGLYALGATAVFCAVDVIIYPTTPDVIVSYFIYWNLLAILVTLFKAGGIKSPTAYLIIALVMTIFFGVLTSLCQSLMTSVSFVAVYLSGLLFFALHLLSTLAFMTAGFSPLVNALTRTKFRYFK